MIDPKLHPEVQFYARLLTLLTEGSSIKVHVFRERQEAAQWLGVPIELLAAEGLV